MASWQLAETPVMGVAGILLGKGTHTHPFIYKHLEIQTNITGGTQMNACHITPGHNGWTHNAKKIINAIDRKEHETQYKAQATERVDSLARVEMEYYEENNCYPRPTGYFGTETDAHFFER